jgi:hypothetical protein
MTNDMEEKLVDKISLQNGLTLELYDRSRPVAGDRWLVSLVARIDVGVDPQHFKGQDKASPPFDDIRRAVGDKVTYSYEKSRNFIADAQREEVFGTLKERFLSATLNYFSNANFPRNIILSRYREVKGGFKAWKKQ